jgi:predicted amidophosphoribosyltransferase
LKQATPGWRLRLAEDVLRRVRDTESQFALTPRQRRMNLRGAFEVTKNAAGARILGREVLLVDDIYTTGATARECARVLRRAGATKVWVATATRAQPELVAMWS